MPPLRLIARRIRGAFRREQVDAEMSDEISAHLELLAAENRQRGMPADEARYAAQRAFGGVEQIKERCRDERRRGLRWLEQLAQDVRFAGRTLRQAPGFTAVAVLTLALGIGANTAIFSVINAVLLQPLPYPDPDRVVDVSEIPPRGGRFAVAPATFLDWQKRNRVFEDMATLSLGSVTLTGVEEPQVLRAMRVSAGFFPLLGVRPALGRTFLPEEDAPGRYGAAVLSHGLWQRLFGGDPEILGRALLLDGESYTVVGVMPAGFDFIARPWDPAKTQLWLPYAFHRDPPTQRVVHRLKALARLKSGVTLESAQADMDAVARGLAEEFPDSNKDWGVKVTRMDEYLAESARGRLLLLMGAAGFVLLVACSNIANLLLTRAAYRQREIAIRSAVGATRSRLVRQLLTESLLLAAAGGVGGVAIAFWGSRTLIALSPGDIPRVDETGVDVHVLGFALAAAVLTGLLAGLAPALQGSRPNLNEWLKEAARSGATGLRRQGVRSALVAAEVALAFVLLFGAGLMINSLVRFHQISAGYDTENALMIRVVLPRNKYAQKAGTASGESFKKNMQIWQVRPQHAAFVNGVIERIASQPDCVAIGAVNYLPLGSMSWGLGFAIDERPDLDPKPMGWHRPVTPDYFRAIGIPLLKGRPFSARDTEHSPPVVIVSEAVARQYWPGENPLGRYLLFSDGELEKPRRFAIVGVAANTRQSISNVLTPGTWGKEARVIYFPERQRAQTYLDFQIYARMGMSFVVRTRGDPARMAAMLRAAVKEIDPDQPIEQLMTMTEYAADADKGYRFYLMLLGLFAGLAMVLSLLGVYGVVSYSVAQRIHEIGVRRALGASPSAVVRLVLRQGFVLALIGVVAGIAGAIGLTRFLSSLLYDVSPTDPMTFAVVSGALIAVTALASYLPARRAARVDPMRALRCE